MVAGGVVREPRVRQSVFERVRRQKQWILGKLRISQKPILDKKVDEMLKEAAKRKRVVVSFYRGLGRSIGKGVGGLRRVGRSVKSILGVK